MRLLNDRGDARKAQFKRSNFWTVLGCNVNEVEPGLPVPRSSV